jgi:hypothetical protein
VKPHLAVTVFVCVLCVRIVYGDDESISRKQLNPPEGRPVEIAMVVERRDGAHPKIIWPRSLRETDIETAKKRFYPHGW